MSLILAIVLAAVGSVAPTGGVAKVTADHAYYDHQEGYAYFSGKVFVDDAEYQLHADRAYVFLNGSNDLKRVVAIGHVAMTNGTKRAYGDKASYYRKSGMVVLDASSEAPAEIRDVAKGNDQVVRGQKIKFWTTTKQVEVQEVWMEGKRSGMSRTALKDVLGR